jgi:LysR family glycine cleavage system transcriptional activator
VSQQIHAVERALGARLFARRGRRVVLTPEGQLYSQDVRRILRELEDAGRRVASRSNSRLVRLSTVDFLAHEFLIPRLPLFEERFPGMELSIETTMRVVDLRASDLDCALRVRGTAPAGLVSEPIGPVTATIVASPTLARRLRTTEDLTRETLLEMGPGAEGSWASAIRRYGHGDRKLRILALESYFQTLTAAERGLGVAFGLFPMTSEWVERGRLAIPFPARSPLEGGVYLVHRPNDPRRALFADLAALLRSEYAALAALPAGRIVPAEPRRARSREGRTRS